MRYPSTGYEDFSGFSNGALSLDADWSNTGAGTPNEPTVASGVLGEAGAGSNESGASYVNTGYGSFSGSGYNEAEIELSDLPDAGFEGILPICHVDASDTDAFFGLLWTGSVLRVVEYTAAFGTFDDFVDTGSVTLGVNDVIRLKISISGGNATCNININGVEHTGGDFPDAVISTALNAGQPGLMKFDAEGTYSVTNFAAADTENGISGSSGITEQPPSGSIALSSGTPKKVMRLIEKVPAHGT